MARPPKLIPSYRKHRHSGQAVCTIARRDYYLGPHGTKTSKLQYDRLIAEWLASGRSPKFGAVERDVTVVELVADYLRHAKQYYGANPRGEYANMKRAAADLCRLYGRSPALEFGPHQLKSVRQTLIEAGGSRTYINACVQRTVRMFHRAACRTSTSAICFDELAVDWCSRKVKYHVPLHTSAPAGEPTPNAVSFSTKAPTLGTRLGNLIGYSACVFKSLAINRRLLSDFA